MIPLLTRIEQQLATCTDPRQRAELLAEKGCYLARTGDFEGARKIVTWLRSRFGDGKDVRISVWIMIVEGLLLFFDRVSPDAWEKLRRALALSEGFQQHDQRLLAAAWLAHLDFNRSNFEGMVTNLSRCVNTPILAVSPAGIRLSLTLADAYMHCGCIAKARAGYETTRRSAIVAGDEAYIAAMIFNKAAMGLTQLRLTSLDGHCSVDEIRFAAMEIESAANYQAGAGHKALPQLFEYCRVGVLLLERRYALAAQRIKCLLSEESVTVGLNFRSEQLELDLAVCLAMSGEVSEAREVFVGIDRNIYEDLALDDRIIFLAGAVRLGPEIVPQIQLELYASALATSLADWRERVLLLRSSLDQASSMLSIK